MSLRWPTIEAIPSEGVRASNDYKEILNLPTTQRQPPLHKTRALTKFRNRTLETVRFDKNVLFRAALSDDIESVKSMNFVNDDINTCDNFGWSALMIAACEGSTNVCKFLLSQQCDWTITDRSGHTALSLAKSKNKQKIVEMLEDKMTNVIRCNETSHTATSQAIKLEPFWCEECQQTFKEATKEAHESSTLHRFNHKNTFEFSRRYFISESNVGFKMMLKQGWDRENGLGPNNEGKLYPIKTTIRKPRSGLGVKQDSSRITHFTAYDRDAIKWRPPPPKAKTKKQLERDAKKCRRKEMARKRNRSNEDVTMDDSARMINLLIEAERLADKIMQNKQEIIALDKRRQHTREAIRELGKSEEKKAWITIGSMLVEMQKEKAAELLQKDQNVIDQEINKLRSDQKVLVGQHRDLEFADPIKGFDLNPLSRDEVGVLRTNLPGF